MTRATGRPTRVAEPTWFRLLLAGGVLLGVVATVLVVVSEEARWLRLAVLAALWAALLAAFAVARARREARVAELKQEEGKRTYELELQREITARREYEAKVIEHARQDSDDRHREELAALREQLDKLTQALSGLLDGDLLVERLTLSAESTRVRQFGGDRGRLIGPQPGIGPGMGPYPQRPLGPPPHRPAPVPPVAEDDTEQISLTKITEHARNVRAGTTAADTVLPDPVVAADPVVADESVVDAGSSPEPDPVVDERAAEVTVEESADAEPVVVDEPVVVELEVDEPAVAQSAVDEDLVDEGDEGDEAETEVVVEPESAVEPEPVVEELVVDEPVVEELVVDEPSVEDVVVDEPVAEEPVVVEPEVVEPVEATQADLESATADEAADEAASTGSEAQAADPDQTEDNHHNAGVSVSDLLAAYGISSERRPRRRRAADDDE